MKRVALIASISLLALVCAGPAEAKAAGSSDSFWAARDAFAAKSEKSEKSTKKHKKDSNERPSESKATRNADKTPPPKGPLHVIVSIEKQRATLFADGEPYATTKISSGMPGHPTPMGVFSVIQKSRHHISNLYDAPMPYMQRITWSGSALHEGPLPGYAASHGCVRLTTEFAQLLWKTTKIGVRVIITRDEVKPEPIEHAKLDALLINATQAERAPDPAPTSAVVKLADVGAMAFASAKKHAPAARAERVAEPSPVVSDAVPAHAPIMPIVSAPAANAADEQATKFLNANGDAEAPVVLMAPHAVAAEEEAVKLPAVEPPAAVAPSAPPAPVSPTQPTKAAEAPAGPLVAAAPIVEAPKAAPKVEAAAVAKPVEQAPVAAAPAPAAVAAPVVAEVAASALIPAPAPIIVEERPATAPAAQAPAPASATPVREANRKPVSLFVSLKDGKLYARQGMEALFDMPISVAHPEQPLGTHVFTAMSAKDGGGLRWTVISIPSNTKRTVEANTEERPRKKRDREAKKVETPEPPLPGAAEALDRIVLPQAAMERLAGLVLPGSSLIVSDNRLSDETNESTEFIVMTR